MNIVYQNSRVFRASNMVLILMVQQFNDDDIQKLYFIQFVHNYKMSTQRQMRAKRSSFIINIIETPNGFSIVEGTEQLNKPEGIVTNQGQTHPSSTISNAQSSHTVPLKDYKPVFKSMTESKLETNLIFLKREQKIQEQGETAEQQIIETPDYCRVFASWFDLNKLSQIERKQVTTWFCQKTGSNPKQLDDKQEVNMWIKLYRKHRNFIVKLYINEFAIQGRYLSASHIRKYLCCDAFWLMKLHLFLSNMGIININSYNYNMELNNRLHIFKEMADGKKELLGSELNTVITKTKVQENQNELLKKLTKDIRPFCDFCRIHCGIVWFQHNRSLDPKQIANIMKNVNSKNPPLSQKEYEYILCVKCYCQANFPLLLTHHDFKKVCVNDRLQPGRKRRNKRRKRKERKIRDGDEEVEDQQIKENGIQEEKSHGGEEEDQGEKKQELKMMITKLVESVHQKDWSLHQTDALLQLIETHEQDWLTIHQKMKKQGFCLNIETEELILYFLSLPRRGVCKLQQEYQDEQFIQANFTSNKTNIFDRLSQKKLNDSVTFSQGANKKLLKQLQEEAKRSDYVWKTRLQDLTKLQIKKYENRLNHLQACQNVVKSLKIFSEKM